jgi:transposase
MRAIWQATPERATELWTMDEHRVGLQPIVRRVWAPCVQQPVAVVQPRYEWLYVYAFVQPQTGASFWLLCPKVTIPWFQVALDAFAQHTGAGDTKHIILVLDQAGWHTSPRIQMPAGIERLYVPPYSPELQPAERLWRLSDEALVNRHFVTLAELEQAQEARCRVLQHDPERIKASTSFWWWPQAP